MNATSSRKKRILFVDDEPLVLQGLQRMLRCQRQEWEMDFVESASEALARMDAVHFDVVVSDMCMPGMNGAQLMAAVTQRHPTTIRVILSGHADRDMILQCVGSTHQYVSKPCEPEALKAVIRRAADLDSLLENERFKKLIGQMERLPSVPSLYTEMVAVLNKPEVSVGEVGALVTRDIAMTAKILKIVNSAFFGLPRQVSDPTEAVTHLGLETFRTLVLAVGAFSQFQSGGTNGLMVEQLWAHSMKVAAWAKLIATVEGQNHTLVDATFVAGLLHDIGKLVLAANFEQEYASVSIRARTGGESERQAEREVFGATHTEVGGYLLGLWGLPPSIVESIALHHEPSLSGEKGLSPLTLVHCANAFARSERPRSPGQPERDGLDLEYLGGIGVLDRLQSWREACLRQTEKP